MIIIKNNDIDFLLNKLQTKVNEKLLTKSNNNSDNEFFKKTLKEVIDTLNKKDYEPFGISLITPFPSSVTNLNIGFVFIRDNKIEWLHMPVNYWCYLLAQKFSNNETIEIIRNLR